MVNAEKDDESGPFCKFCGSKQITQAEYESTNDYGGRGKHMIQGIQGQFAGFGGGVNMGTRDQAKVNLPTWFCKTCRKIDCKDSIIPLEAKFHEGEFTYKFIIPSAFQELLTLLNVDESFLKDLLEKLSKKMKRNIRSFLKSGTNPCKSGEIGFKKKVLISSISIEVRILMENFQGELLARIIYGGGKSQCP